MMANLCQRSFKAAGMLNECLLINTNPVNTLWMLRNVTQSALNVFRLLQVQERHEPRSSKRYVV